MRMWGFWVELSCFVCFARTGEVVKSNDDNDDWVVASKMFIDFLFSTGPGEMIHFD